MDNTPSKLQLPGIFMVVMGAMGSLFSGAGVLSTLINLMQGVAYNGDEAHMAGQYVGIGIGGLSSVLGIGLGALIAFGGWSLYNGQRRSLVMASAVALCIPCFWSCCGLGIPLGIWVLVSLNQPDAHEHFNA